MAIHSLWLVPDRTSPAFAELKSIIADLARRFDTPVFDPHVTVLGGVAAPLGALLAGAEALAASLSPVEIALGDIVSRGVYFQRVIALVAQTPPLLATRRDALAAFDAAPIEYKPHLSLAYGDLSEPDTKTLIAAAAEANGARFIAPVLEVWRTDRAVGAWTRAGAFRIAAARAR